MPYLPLSLACQAEEDTLKNPSPLWGEGEGEGEGGTNKKKHVAVSFSLRPNRELGMASEGVTTNTLGVYPWPVNLSSRRDGFQTRPSEAYGSA